jgi:hypothetical protein
MHTSMQFTSSTNTDIYLYLARRRVGHGRAWRRGAQDEGVYETGDGCGLGSHWPSLSPEGSATIAAPIDMGCARNTRTALQAHQLIRIPGLYVALTIAQYIHIYKCPCSPRHGGLA